MRFSNGITNGLMVVSVVCAVSLTGMQVWERFGPAVPPTGPSALRGADTVRIPDWQHDTVGGHHLGLATAPVTIIEFADLECPVCRQFTIGALAYIRAKYPTDVQVVFRHWPLSYHHFAYPAARAAECAAAQGRFDAFQQLVHAKQDSLGLKAFGDFAREAEVPDARAFATCNAQTGPVAAVEADINVAKAVGGRGTPTIVINGLRLTGAPDSASLGRLIESALKQIHVSGGTSPGKGISRTRLELPTTGTLDHLETPAAVASNIFTPNPNHAIATPEGTILRR